MTSGETLSRASGSGPAAGVTAVVVVVHGGQSVSTEPTSATQLAVLRMIPVVQAVRHTLRGSGALVCRPRLLVRGWNGEQASPVPDLSRILDHIGAEFGPVPIVLVGHSMGARAAFRVAGHRAVSAVAGLAPWLPPGEPVAQLAGRRVLLAHGSADNITRPDDTWAYAERVRPVAQAAVLEIRGGDHPMIRRAVLWHDIAAEFTRSALGLPPRETEVAAAVSRTSANAGRAVL